MASSRPLVVISYHHADRTAASYVHALLVASGMPAWLDQCDIPIGAYWPDEIDRALKRSDAVVGLASAASVESSEVTEAWDWAISNARRLLLVRIGPCRVPQRYVTNDVFDAPADGLADTLLPLIHALGGEPPATAVPKVFPPDSSAVGSIPPGAFALGRYTVTRVLADGIRTRLYHCRDTVFERDVALALIDTAGLDDSEVERIRSRTRELGRLTPHPMIVPILDLGDERGQPYVVSELVNGGTLEATLSRAPDRRLPLERTLRIADQILEALTHAHGQGVVHRDLRPGNVWVATDGAVRLGNFGLALPGDEARRAAPGTVGMVDYLSPEQALGATPGTASDLYSFGALLYELVTGRPPFLADNPLAVISQHINGLPVAPAWHNAYVPKQLEALILQLLAKDPADRPVSAMAVRQEIQATDVLGGSPLITARAQERSPTNPLDRLAGRVFVGRGAELSQLHNVVDAAIAGHASVTLLAGEPGIGKTTLADEAITYASMRGVQALWGRCYEWEGAPPYWPWVQIIRHYVEGCAPARLRVEMGIEAATIAQIVPQVQEYLTDVPDVPRMDGEQARFRLFDSIVTFLRRATASQPLLLVLDDLHWADVPSLLLLQFVAREMAQGRLLMIGTYRDTEISRHHPLTPTLAELARGSATYRIALRGLVAGDIARLIQLSTGSMPDARMIEAVERETEGNPFFVNEIVRLLVTEGGLGQSPTTTRWNMNIPESVRDVVGRRLDRLSAACNDLLIIASVVGREFTLDLLERVSGLRGDELFDAIEEALRARLIQEEVPAHRYRFTHALVQETLYSELSGGRRLRLHADIAHALMQLYAADLAPSYGELAHHFAVAAPAGHAASAIEYAVKAGDLAMTQLAWETAIQHYERALQVMEMQPDSDLVQRCDVLLTLGVAHFRTVLDVSESPEGRQVFLQAAEIAKSINSFERLARAALGFAGINVVRTGGGLQQARLLGEALALAPADDSPLKARVMARLAVDCRVLPDMTARSIALSDEALAMVRRLDDQAVLGAVLVARYSAVWSPDALEERLAVALEGARVAELAGDVSSTLWSHYFTGLAAYEAGDIELLDRANAQSTEAAQRSGMPYFRWVASLWRAGNAIREGRFADIDVSQPELGGHSQALVAYYARMLMLFPLYRERIHTHAIDDEIQAVIDLARASTDPFDRHRGNAAWAMKAILLAEAGQLDGARDAFEVLASRDFADLPRDAYWLGSLVLLAEASVLLGDRRRAAALYDLLLPYADRNVLTASSYVPFGPVSYYLGLLASLLDHLGSALPHFREALAMNERMRDWPAGARTQHALASALLTHGAPGDRTDARELLDRALGTAQTLGMLRLQEQVRALLATLGESGSGTAGTPARPQGLSARELEVLRLIVSGNSDRQIAEALFISPRTVTTHVSNIFNKLGLSTRAEAAAFAVRHELV